MYHRIKDTLNPSSNVIITNPRKDRPNSNITVCLDITDIHILKNKIKPLFLLENILKSKKLKDFKDWSMVVDIYYLGYHLLPEGKFLIKEIKNS